MTRYGPAFAASTLLCMVAAGSGVALWGGTYLRNLPDGLAYMVMGAVTLILLFSAGQLAMIRGFRWGLWLLLPSLVLPALTAISLFGTRHAGAMQMAILTLSLLGLLVLNSKRHRAMRQRLIELRLQRAGTLPPTRMDEFPDGPPPKKAWFSTSMLVLAALIVMGKIYMLFWG
ncbi:hypothetical protein ACIQUF_02260 [Pseudomonas sp. NPDC090233]|uniref:hypothetical protein n=1 Tax=Pseudomonas sp. NPDC090233 TaxID=3364479 RepID=UPI00383BA2EE